MTDTLAWLNTFSYHLQEPKFLSVMHTHAWVRHRAYAILLLDISWRTSDCLSVTHSAADPRTVNSQGSRKKEKKSGGKIWGTNPLSQCSHVIENTLAMTFWHARQGRMRRWMRGAYLHYECAEMRAKICFRSQVYVQSFWIKHLNDFPSCENDLLKSSAEDGKNFFDALCSYFPSFSV